MPIYEYRCSKCGHEHEALQKITEAPLTVCPACGQPALTKLVSAAGFQLKGTGWYATDFRNGSRPAAKKSEGTGEAAKTDKAGKSESKTEKAETTSTSAKSGSTPSGGSTSS